MTSSRAAWLFLKEARGTHQRPFLKEARVTHRRETQASDSEDGSEQSDEGMEGTDATTEAQSPVGEASL
jgi:hypothetical protein